jgi:hypothetical protein
MGKRKQKRKPRKTPKPQVKIATPKEGIQPIEGEAHPPRGKRYFSQTITAVRLFWGAIAVAIAVLGAWVILKPNVHVDPYIRLNPSSPFSERFKLSNDGYFGIYDVQYDCTLAWAKTDHGLVVHDALIRGRYGASIEAGQSISIDCPLDNVISTDAHYVSAEITLGIEFRPTWYFWRKRKQTSFSGQLDSQGNVQWIY